MPHSSWFQCIDTECSERKALTEIVYTCPRCDGLLMVAHDVEALKNRSGAAWMRLFDDRYITRSFPTETASGARRSGSTRRSTTPTSSQPTKVARTCSGPSASGR